MRYDVAFSFLSQDEPLANDLASRLQGRAEVFIHSERQKEAAGTDGMDFYSTIFGAAAKVCVVLYRQRWGETAWTGAEQSAIKNRGIRGSWAFLLVISLDGTAPEWLPVTQIWLGWERFGSAAALAVIERKVTESGGSIRELGPVEHAELVAQRRTAAAATEAFLHSTAGVKAARDEVTSLLEYWIRT